mmetsp:Transcript_6935/g.17933  ORF Transcript_6935/g.17933 Transcript_6935/m.17933 type:complete len:309 (+) Transcript_6935:2569-3495(+)
MSSIACAGLLVSARSASSDHVARSWMLDSSSHSGRSRTGRLCAPAMSVSAFDAQTAAAFAVPPPLPTLRPRAPRPATEKSRRVARNDAFHRTSASIECTVEATSRVRSRRVAASDARLSKATGDALDASFASSTALALRRKASHASTASLRVGRSTRAAPRLRPLFRSARPSSMLGRLFASCSIPRSTAPRTPLSAALTRLSRARALLPPFFFERDAPTGAIDASASASGSGACANHSVCMASPLSSIEPGATARDTPGKRRATSALQSLHSTARARSVLSSSRRKGSASHCLARLWYSLGSGRSSRF